MKESFPTTDWQSFYGEHSPSPQRLEWRLWQVYAAAGGTAVLFSAGVGFLSTEAVSAEVFTIVSLAFLALLAGEIFLLILMNAYKKDRRTYK